MINKYKIIVVALLCCLQIACYKDHTTVDTKGISDIQIEIKNFKEIVNIDKNEVLEIKPIISQTTDSKPLSYEWKLDETVISTEKDLRYTGDKLGAFNVRLKVSNEDGSAFKRFVIYVNAPYEEGLIVLGEKEGGDGTLAFLRIYSVDEIAAGKVEHFATDLFSLNNPGHQLGKGPSDVVKRGNKVFLASKEDGSVRSINDKTFELEALIAAPDFPDFKPFRLNIPDGTGTSAIVLTNEGKLFTMATNENLILANTLVKTVPLLQNAKFDLKTAYVPTYNYTMNFFWDKVNSRLWNFWSYDNTSTLNELAGQDLVQFFYANDLMYVITKDKINPAKFTKSVFGSLLQVRNSSGLVDIRDNKEEFINAALTLNEHSITLVSEKYIKLIYANDRSIYHWFYTDKAANMPASPFITIDVPGVITDIVKSTDGTKLYVGIYNAQAANLKGSVLVYDIDKGTLLKKYEAVIDKPVRMFYKTKK